MRKAQYQQQAYAYTQDTGDPFVDEPSTSAGTETQPPMHTEGAVADGMVYNEQPGFAEEAMAWDAPPPAVSSGEWLKNGLWYTQQSAVYMERSSNVKNSIRLSEDISSSQIPHYRNRLELPLGLGYEPGLRSTLGRFVGRDDRNRDHSVEFTFLGLTHWHANEQMTAFTPGGIFTDLLIDPSFTIPVFNAADFQSFYETSSFNSYEINYRIERRLPRDRVLYTRDSTWVRQAESTPLPSLLAGIRVAVNNESLRWFSESALGTGTYNTITHNNMVGPQFGVDWFYERSDWRFGVRGKAAAVVNWADVANEVRILDVNGAPLAPNRDENAEDHVLSFLAEINVIGVYHLKPHFALRTSYDLMFLTNQALAQNQITFTPGTRTPMGHALFFQGVTFGFELTR